MTTLRRDAVDQWLDRFGGGLVAADEQDGVALQDGSWDTADRAVEHGDALGREGVRQRFLERGGKGPHLNDGWPALVCAINLCGP